MGAGVAASALSAPWVARAAGTIKIGVVTPATGPLAHFGATDGWTIDKIRKLLADGLDTSAGKYNVEILVRDGQSDPNRAAEVAGDLILNEDVHIIMPTSTTDMVSNTMDQAELNQCPCISSGAPWQAVIFPRGGDKKPFDWTYHFFWGLDEALNTFVGLWNTHRNQPQGRHAVPAERRWRDLGQRQLRPAGADQGGRLRGHRAGLLPAAHQRLHGADHRLQVGQLRHRRRHHLSDDFKTFVNQCAQQGYKPKAITVAAALLFAAGVEALGDLGDGMSSEVWWTPAFPFKSTLTGQVSRDIADKWEAEQNKQWEQPLGYQHANWEVMLDILKRSKDPLDRTANRDAMAATKINTLIGTVDFSNGPHKNVSTTPIFGGQWVKGGKWKYDLKIVDNTVNKLFEPEQKMKLLPWSA